MIRDLSETLSALLTQPGLPPELAAAQILFDRPSEAFNPTQTAINLFLYDIRENMALRGNEPIIERDQGQAIMRRPPLRLDCSYLVTAWPVGGTDVALQEHRLLGQVLQSLARYPKIPPAFLRGSLVGQQPALPLMAAKMEGLKDPRDFWTAIGNKLRTSITVTATIAMETLPAQTTPLVSTNVLHIGTKDSDGGELIVPPAMSAFFQIGGQVLGADNKPLASVALTVLETGVTVYSGPDGRYQLGALAEGQHTVQVKIGNTLKNIIIAIPAGAGKDYNLRV